MDANELQAEVMDILDNYTEQLAKGFDAHPNLMMTGADVAAVLRAAKPKFREAVEQALEESE